MTVDSALEPVDDTDANSGKSRDKLQRAIRETRNKATLLWNKLQEVRRQNQALLDKICDMRVKHRSKQLTIVKKLVNLSSSGNDSDSVASRESWLRRSIPSSTWTATTDDMRPPNQLGTWGVLE